MNQFDYLAAEACELRRKKKLCHPLSDEAFKLEMQLFSVLSMQMGEA